MSRRGRGRGRGRAGPGPRPGGAGGHGSPPGRTSTSNPETAKHQLRPDAAGIGAQDRGPGPPQTRAAIRSRGRYRREYRTGLRDTALERSTISKRHDCTLSRGESSWQYGDDVTRSRSGQARLAEPATARQVTIQDVACAAGVSRQTVSNVLNGSGRVGD